MIRLRDRAPGSPWQPIGYVLRHLLSIVLLPITVAVLIPIWIGRGANTIPAVPRGAGAWILTIIGGAVLATGLVLFAASLRQFFLFGRGTLAPWDPPRRLVVRGPYRYVRNPMISGVVFILFGTALMLRSVPHGGWAVTFLLINCVYIPLLEEPALEDRFGEDYQRYRRHVRRFIPRLVPWTPDRTESR